MHLEKSNVGLIGLGTVGKSVVQLWPGAQDIILKKIADKDKNAAQSIKLKKGIFSTNAEDILNDPEIDIVIELVGGIDDAYRYIKSAIDKGKHVVTANKALLALKGEELEKKAMEKGVSIGYEAAVCAGVPILRAISNGLVANKIKSIYGIINGTANFILSSMEEKGIGFRDALSQARAQGFAERNASLDIDGFDSQHKLAVLTRLSFKTSIKLSDIYVEGIRRITHSDIIYARGLGYNIKLLAIAKKEGKKFEARIHPTLIPEDNLLSSVRGIYNACFVEGDACGKMLFYGQGAGGLPTASAILSDVADIASPSSFQDLIGRSTIFIKPIDNLFIRYYIRFSTVDKPGVLSTISGILSKHNISIASVIQKERRGSMRGSRACRGRGVPIIMMTHEAQESSMRKAISSIDRLSVVKEKSLFIRVEEFED